jgi:hypothetical protein
MPSVVLRHATPARNLRSIRKSGLLRNKAKGLLKAIWFHRPSRTEWAILHVARRHKVNVDDVVVLEVRVPRSWLRHTNKRSLFNVSRDVRPGQIVEVLELAQLVD